MHIRPPRARVLLVTVIAAGLTGCSAPDAPSPAAPASPPATPSTTAIAPLPPAAADGTNLEACRDGACEVRVEGPAEIPVPPGSDYRSIRVVQDGADLGLEVRRKNGGSSRFSGGVRVSGPQGTIEFESLGGGVAVLRLTPPGA